MTDPRVEILDKTICYNGFFRIERYRLRHRLYSGAWSRELTRELFERGHAAAVLPYDPILDAVVLVEQFRIGALEAPGDPWLLEIVAGVMTNLMKRRKTSPDVKPSKRQTVIFRTWCIFAITSSARAGHLSASPCFAAKSMLQVQEVCTGWQKRKKISASSWCPLPRPWRSCRQATLGRPRLSLRCNGCNSTTTNFARVGEQHHERWHLARGRRQAL